MKLAPINPWIEARRDIQACILKRWYFWQTIRINHYRLLKLREYDMFVITTGRSFCPRFIWRGK